MAKDEKISQALGIEFSKQEILPPENTQSKELVVTNNDQVDDYKLSRETFRDLIEKGKDAIEGISDLAKQSDSPRAYEVMATLIKTVSDTTKDLYDLQKKTRDLNQKPDEKIPLDSVNIDKAIFVGSPTQLLRKVKEGK